MVALDAMEPAPVCESADIRSDGIYTGFGCGDGLD